MPKLGCHSRREHREKLAKPKKAITQSLAKPCAQTESSSKKNSCHPYNYNSTRPTKIDESESRRKTPVKKERKHSPWVMFKKSDLRDFSFEKTKVLTSRKDNLEELTQDSVRMSPSPQRAPKYPCQDEWFDSETEVSSKVIKVVSDPRTDY